jgi:hypothetical protein
MMTTAKVFGAVVIALVVGVPPASAQQGKFDLLIRGGHVIDPRNAIDAVMDVAIAGGKIAEVPSRLTRPVPIASPTQPVCMSFPD